MPGPHDYTRGTTAGLLSLAKGTCYYPGCPAPIVIKVDGKPQPNYMTAHIRAAKPNGPRYVKEMSDDERRDFPNLVLLCLAHHNTVDGPDRDKYTIAILEKWKSDREKATWAELKGLREVTEDRLQGMIAEALEIQAQKINEVIKRLDQSDPQAARILRELATGLNPDTADMFNMAARDLRPVLNPDVVDMLSTAVRDLRPVLNPDVVDMLSTTAGELRLALNPDRFDALTDGVGQLRQSATRLNQVLYELIDSLSVKIDELRRLQGGM